MVSFKGIRFREGHYSDRGRWYVAYPLSDRQVGFP
jgi:hypothetical protein